MFINRREIWLLDFEPTKGIEIQKIRPALVLQKFSQDHFVVLPITSTKKNISVSFKLSDISFLKKVNNYVNISRIRTVDKQRFIRRFGKLSNHVFKKIKSKTAGVLKLLPQGPSGHNVN